MQNYIKDKIEEISAQYPDKKSAIIPALDIIQREKNNNLSSEDIREVAHYLGTTESRAYGVATYYTMFNVKPVGTYHLQVDTNIPGFLTGADEILKHLEKKLGIKTGQTTADGLFTLTSVQDLGSCGTCPVIQVNDIYYENMTLEKTDMLIDSLRKGIMPEPDKTSYYGTECNILLKNRGKGNSRSIKTYKSNGGYKTLEKALSDRKSTRLNSSHRT